MHLAWCAVSKPLKFRLRFSCSQSYALSCRRHCYQHYCPPTPLISAVSALLLKNPVLPKICFKNLHDRQAPKWHPLSCRPVSLSFLLLHPCYMRTSDSAVTRSSSFWFCGILRLSLFTGEVLGGRFSLHRRRAGYPRLSVIFILPVAFRGFAFRQHVLFDELRHIADAGRERAQVGICGGWFATGKLADVTEWGIAPPEHLVCMCYNDPKSKKPLARGAEREAQQFSRRCHFGGELQRVRIILFFVGYI